LLPPEVRFFAPNYISAGPQTPLGELRAALHQTPMAGFKGPTSKRREGRGMKGKRRGRENGKGSRGTKMCTRCIISCKPMNAKKTAIAHDCPKAIYY